MASAVHASSVFHPLHVEKAISVTFLGYSEGMAHTLKLWETLENFYHGSESVGVASLFSLMFNLIAHNTLTGCPEPTQVTRRSFHSNIFRIFFLKEIEKCHFNKKKYPPGDGRNALCDLVCGPQDYAFGGKLLLLYFTRATT